MSDEPSLCIGSSLTKKSCSKRMTCERYRNYLYYQQVQQEPVLVLTSDEPCSQYIPIRHVA
ncbi:hypothetical protein [Marinobacterium litorale]|uniref:hypothetical protein n=1 Tax=Marinobacterium litorale TaxID=404770 RepID=UPI0012EBE2BD|nr:hypothetical protein [Marinobacterium litorale]